MTLKLHLLFEELSIGETKNNDIIKKLIVLFELIVCQILICEVTSDYICLMNVLK